MTTDPIDLIQTAQAVTDAASAANATPVTVKGFTWTAAAGWSIFAMMATVLTMFTKAVGFPRLVEIWEGRNKERRTHAREDELTEEQRIKRLEDRMERLSTAFGFVMNAVQFSSSAVSIDDGRIRLQLGKQCSDAIAMAASVLGEEDPFTKALNQLAASLGDHIVVPANVTPAPPAH